MTCLLSTFSPNNLRQCHALLCMPGRRLFLSKQYFTALKTRHKANSNRALFTCMRSNSTSHPLTFQGKDDRFEGVTVFSEQEPCGTEDLPNKLKHSLELWKTLRKRGVWFRVHIDQSEWIPVLAKNGFKYHHAKGDYVMMYLWLANGEKDNTPSYAHTMIGVGAVVVNDRHQVLVVKEKHNFLKRPMWKLPGGHVEPGENLVDAALREVEEETGIPTEFQSILTFRQGHNGIFGCSDIYVVVNLKALREDIKKCDREIAECQWMDIEEYLSHPHIHELNRFFVSKLLHHKKHNFKIDCHHGIHQILKKPFTVYSVFKADDKEEVEKVPFKSFPPKKAD